MNYLLNTVSVLLVALSVFVLGVSLDEWFGWASSLASSLFPCTDCFVNPYTLLDPSNIVDQ